MSGALSSGDAPSTDAGRELDALVAVQVMGWRWARPSEPRAGYVHFASLIAPGGFVAKYLTVVAADDDVLSRCEKPMDNLPHYSTDIAAAWSILARIHGTSATAPEWPFSRRMRLYAALEEVCATTTGCPVAWPAAMGVFHDQMPALICHAALSACDSAPSSPMGR